MFLLAPFVFAWGIQVCWIGLGMGRDGDNLPLVSQMGTGVIVTLLAQFQLAAAFLCVGWWFDPSRGRRRCPKCWYDMSGSARALCPECGNEARTERQLYRTRRKHGLIWVALLIVLSTYVTFRAPRARTTSLFAFVPTSLLIATFEYWPDELILNRIPGASTASLLNRVDEEELFGWQRAWLSWRAQHLLIDSTDPRSIQAALRLLPRTWRGAESLRHPDENAVRKLFLMLGSEDAQTRAAAADLIQYLPDFYAYQGEQPTRWDEVASQCAPMVIPGLEDSNWNVAWAAIEVISRSDDALDPHIDRILAPIATDTSPRRQATTQRVWAVGRAAQKSQIALDAFLKLTESGDGVIRIAAARAAGNVCGARPELLPRMLKMIDDPVDMVAVWAARSLSPLCKNEEFVRLLLHNAQTRTAGQDEFISLIGEAFPRERDGVTLLPPWVTEQLGVIVGDSSAYSSVRMAVARLAEYFPTGSESLMPRLRAFAGERSLSPSDQAELDRIIAGLEVAQQTLPRQDP